MPEEMTIFSDQIDGHVKTETVYYPQYRNSTDTFGWRPVKIDGKISDCRTLEAALAIIQIDLLRHSVHTYDYRVAVCEVQMQYRISDLRLFTKDNA